jgi:hypothetical protein
MSVATQHVRKMHRHKGTGWLREIVRRARKFKPVLNIKYLSFGSLQRWTSFETTGSHLFFISSAVTYYMCYDSVVDESWIGARKHFQARAK